MPKWMPIETVPKDKDSYYLVFTEGGDIDLAFWHHDHVCGKESGWDRFTHWMPLPSPPE